MKNSEKYEKAFNYFKSSYNYKMGGTQTVILPNGKSKYFDDRRYYSGRGAKYNSSVRHDHIGDVKVTRKEYSEFLKILKKREQRNEENEMKRMAKNQRISKAQLEGKYSIKDGYVELTNKEVDNCEINVARLSNTLEIKKEDCELLINSIGKTYVFAKVENSDKILMLYHPSLECNDLSIYVEFDQEKVKNHLSSMNHEEWVSAPFSKMLGQTNNKNHFVC